MNITTTINGSKWEIEFFTDYKHKSRIIHQDYFMNILLQCYEFPTMEQCLGCLEQTKNAPEGMEITQRVNLRDLEPKQMLPGDVIVKLTSMFGMDPRFPVDIKMKHDNETYKIHFKKDGSMKLRHRYRPCPNNDTPPETPITPQPHDRHWL